jgi:CubicO group peptidase (beta-lactamase class C family)
VLAGTLAGCASGTAAPASVPAPPTPVAATTAPAAASGGTPAPDRASTADPAPAATPAPAGDDVPSADAAAASDAPELDRADVDAWLDGLLPAALERSRIAGATVSVVHDGALLTARGYGWADTGADGGEPVPVDPARTLFRPGSVSKLVTATAVMQLVESGDVDLDTDVAEYLDFDVPRAFDDPITLRHLLSHTAGFEERVAGTIGGEEDTVDLRAALATDPPEQVYRPGTTPAYSNYGNALAGYVVEHVSGEPFEQYVQEHVLERAGMTSSTFVQPLPADLRDRMSRGYPTASEPAVPFEVVGVPPAGALSAPATDMAGFMLGLLGEPTGDPLLEPATLELMRQPALDEDALGTLAAGDRMALGFFQEDRNGHRIVGHGGDTNVFHAHLQLYPEERTGIYVSLNGSGAGALDSLQIREQVMHGFADRYFPGPAGTGETVDADTAREHAALAAGTYTDSRAMHSTFLAAVGVLSPTHVTAEEDGRIVVSPGPLSDRPVRYEEVEPFVWQEVGGQRTIAARATDGQVDAIGYDSAFTLLRADPAVDLALPVVAASAVVLLLGLLAWPVGALVRRFAHRPTRREPAGRPARAATRVASAAALVALVGWTATVTAVMSFQDPPVAALRGLQALQGIGLLGLVPALVAVVGDVRRRAGWWRVAGSVLVLLALTGVAWFAVTYRLLAPSLSY